MQEIILNNKKNGMLVMVLDILLLIVATLGTVFGGILMDMNVALGVLLFAPSVILVCVGWIPLLGLKVFLKALGIVVFGGIIAEKAVYACCKLKVSVFAEIS